MEASTVLDRYEETHQRWLEQLAGLDDSDFRREPEDGGWSIGEVCSHVGVVADALLDRAERCAAGEGERRRTSLIARLLFWWGSFPPIRIKLPELPTEFDEIRRPPPLGRDGALRRLHGVADRMRALRRPVAAADPAIKQEHPAGFWLDARRFYQNNEMHARHHLRQLSRLTADDD